MLFFVTASGQAASDIENVQNAQIEELEMMRAPPTYPETVSVVDWSIIVFYTDQQSISEFVPKIPDCFYSAAEKNLEHEYCSNGWGQKLWPY